MHLTVMSILVFRLTGEASKVGFTIAFQFAPMLFLGAYAGAMADRLNKRKMAIITQSAMASQALLLGCTRPDGGDQPAAGLRDVAVSRYSECLR